MKALINWGRAWTTVAVVLVGLRGAARAADWPVSQPPAEVIPSPPFDTTIPPRDEHIPNDPSRPPTDNSPPGTGQPPLPSDDIPSGPPAHESPEPATLGLVAAGLGVLCVPMFNRRAKRS
jgi:hypothetical protein